MAKNTVKNTEQLMKDKMILHCVLSLERAKKKLGPNRKRVDRNYVKRVIIDAQKLSPSINRQQIYYQMRKREKQGVAGSRPTSNVLNDAFTLATNITINNTPVLDSTNPQIPISPSDDLNIALSGTDVLNTHSPHSSGCHIGMCGFGLSTNGMRLESR